jgi:hypothetical protein
MTLETERPHLIFTMRRAADSPAMPPPTMATGGLLGPAGVR